MALINCPECGKPVSTSAHACPNCGYPIAEALAQKAAAEKTPLPVPAQNQLLAEVRPSWWGFFWYLFFFWLIVPPFIAYFRRARTVLRIYPDRIRVVQSDISLSPSDGVHLVTHLIQAKSR